MRIKVRQISSDCTSTTCFRLALHYLKKKVKSNRNVGFRLFFFRKPHLVSEEKFILIVVRRDIRGIGKLWSPMCSWWWISMCLQSLLWPWTPGKMRRWNVSPHVVKNQIHPTMAHKRTPTWGLGQHSKKWQTHMPPQAKHTAAKKPTVEWAENTPCLAWLIWVIIILHTNLYNINYYYFSSSVALINSYWLD